MPVPSGANKSTWMQTKYKNTREKFRSIYPSLVWHDTKKMKKKVDTGKLVRKTIQVGIANNIYDKLFNDKETKPTSYKTSWLLDSAASGHYADDKTIVEDKKKIQPRTGIEVGCANTGVMHQTGEVELPFNNIPNGTDEVNIFHNMHSPLLSGGNLSRKENAH